MRSTNWLVAFKIILRWTTEPRDIYAFEQNSFYGMTEYFPLFALNFNVIFGGYS